MLVALSPSSFLGSVAPEMTHFLILGLNISVVLRRSVTGDEPPVTMRTWKFKIQTELIVEIVKPWSQTHSPHTPKSHPQPMQSLCKSSCSLLAVILLKHKILCLVFQCFFLWLSRIILPFSLLTRSWYRRGRNARCLEAGDPPAIPRHCRRTQCSGLQDCLHHPYRSHPLL